MLPPPAAPHSLTCTAVTSAGTVQLWSAPVWTYSIRARVTTWNVATSPDSKPSSGVTWHVHSSPGPVAEAGRVGSSYPVGAPASSQA